MGIRGTRRARGKGVSVGRRIAGQDSCELRSERDQSRDKGRQLSRERIRPVGSETFGIEPGTIAAGEIEHFEAVAGPADFGVPS